MRILHVARECAPLAKAGGLADVVGALPTATLQADGGVQAASVLLPAYDSLLPRRGEVVLEGAVRVGSERLAYRVTRGLPAEGAPDHWLVEHECFAGPAPYGGDDLRREVVLSAAALELGASHDVVHVHDHHAALACVGLATHPPPRPTLLTVHNARYHGVLPWTSVDSLDLPAGLDRGACDHGGAFNRLKAAVLHASLVTTVSPTHARDLLEEGESSAGLDYAFRLMGDRFVGILNGIDVATWDPAADPFLDAHWSRGDLAGKAAQKRATCSRLGLDASAPLLAFVGRLVSEKGIDALVEGLPVLLAEQPRLQAILLGRGDARYESAFAALQARLAPRVAVSTAHDEGFAHALYGAADALLAPSWHEPCGLTQMYAMRYGAVPVVHPTGGLRDSVAPFDPATGVGTGAWMDAPDGAGLARAVRRVLGWMEDEATWSRIRDNAMAADHSWGASAARYVAAYRRATEVR